MKSPVSITAIIALLLGVGACQQGPEAAYVNEGPTVDVMRAGVDAYLAQDWAAFAAVHADSAIFYPSTVEGIPMADRIVQHQAVFEQFDDVRFELLNIAAMESETEQWAFFWGQWMGTHTQTGDQVAFPIHVSAWFEDGVIVAEYEFWDRSPVMPYMQPPVEE